MTTLAEEKHTTDMSKDPEYISSDDSFPEDIAENKVDPEIEVEQLAQELGINQKKLMWKIDLCQPHFVFYISFHFGSCQYFQCQYLWINCRFEINW